jgi:hypothetical protein
MTQNVQSSIRIIAGLFGLFTFDPGFAMTGAIAEVPALADHTVISELVG